MKTYSHNHEISVIGKKNTDSGSNVPQCSIVYTIHFHVKKKNHLKKKNPHNLLKPLYSVYYIITRWQVLVLCSSRMPPVRPFPFEAHCVFEAAAAAPGMSVRRGGRSREVRPHVGGGVAAFVVRHGWQGRGRVRTSPKKGQSAQWNESPSTTIWPWLKPWWITSW